MSHTPPVFKLQSDQSQANYCPPKAGQSVLLQFYQYSVNLVQPCDCNYKQACLWAELGEGRDFLFLCSSLGEQGGLCLSGGNIFLKMSDCFHVICLGKGLFSVV